MSSASASGAGAGRGVLYIAFAKLYFILASFAMQAVLTRVLARATFGAYSIVAGWASPFNNVMVTGSIQAVSRFTAQRPEHARAVQRAGLRMHVFVGVPVALAFVAASPLIAWFQKDWSLVAPLALAGAIIAGYSFYAVFVGTANGRREFHKQAGLDITFATLRVGGIVAMAVVGLGVFGMIGGWVAAVAAILILAIAWVGTPGKPADVQPVRPMIKFFVGVAVYLSLFNVLMFVDLWLLKRLATDHFAEHRGELASAVTTTLPWLGGVIDYHPTPSTLADVQAGYYTAVQYLARLSYQAIIAATFVVFPLVSRSTFDDDRETTKRYINVTMRYSLIFAMAIAVVMAANPVNLLDVVFPPDYAERGGPALAALALGNVAFSLFAIAGTMLNGAGLTVPAIVTAALTLAIAVIGNLIAIPMVEPGRGLLLVAAAVTGGAMVIGAVISGWVLRRRLGAFVPLLTLARVAIAVVAALAVGRVIPFASPIASLVEAAIVGVVFLVVLIVTRELGRDDLKAIASIRKRGGATGGEVA